MVGPNPLAAIARRRRISGPAGGANLDELAEAACRCVQHGLLRMVVTVRRPVPPSFPRGEFLAENHEGDRNLAVDPVRVLAFVQRVRAQARYSALVEDKQP